MYAGGTTAQYFAKAGAVALQFLPPTNSCVPWHVCLWLNALGSPL